MLDCKPSHKDFYEFKVTMLSLVRKVLHFPILKFNEASTIQQYKEPSSNYDCRAVFVTCYSMDIKLECFMLKVQCFEHRAVPGFSSKAPTEMNPGTQDADIPLYQDARLREMIGFLIVSPWERSMQYRSIDPSNDAISPIDYSLALVNLRRQKDHILFMVVDRLTRLQPIWNRLFSTEQSGFIIPHVMSKIEHGLSAASGVEDRVASDVCDLLLAIARSLTDGYAIFEHLSAAADELDDASWQALSEGLAGVIRAEAVSHSFPLL